MAEERAARWAQWDRQAARQEQQRQARRKQEAAVARRKRLLATQQKESSELQALALDSAERDRQAQSEEAARRRAQVGIVDHACI